MLPPNLRQLSIGSAENRPIICLPHAGGGANFVNPLLPHLISTVAVWSFEYPGHLARLTDPLAVSLVALAEEVHTAILARGLHNPVLYGHSMGGRVAFEAAHLLEMYGEPVHSLVVSGSEPPDTRLRRHFSTASRDVLVDELVSMGGVPPLVLESQDFINIFLEIIRGDYYLLETYRCKPKTRLSCPIVVLSGESDATARKSEMPAWARFTSANTRFVNFMGGHFFPYECPSGVAAELLAACHESTARSAPT